MDVMIIDLLNKNKVMKIVGDKFNVLLMFEVDVSDEVFFVNFDWIKNNEDDVNMFVSVLVSVWWDMVEDLIVIFCEIDLEGLIG